MIAKIAKAAISPVRSLISGSKGMRGGVGSPGWVRSAGLASIGLLGTTAIIGSISSNRKKTQNMRINNQMRRSQKRG